MEPIYGRRHSGATDTKRRVPNKTTALAESVPVTDDGGSRPQ